MTRPATESKLGRGVQPEFTSNDIRWLESVQNCINDMDTKLNKQSIAPEGHFGVGQKRYQAKEPLHMTR